MHKYCTYPALIRYFLPGPVSNWMDDRQQMCKPSLYVTVASYPGQLNLAIPSCDSCGANSSGLENWSELTVCYMCNKSVVDIVSRLMLFPMVDFIDFHLMQMLVM